MKDVKVTAPRILLNSVRLLAAMGAIAMASTGECELLFIGVFLSFFLLGMKIEHFPVLSKIMGAAQPYMATVVFIVALLDFFFLSNSFLLSVAHFLLSLQGLRLLVLRTNRENLGSILLSSMMMLSASTLAVNWSYFAMLMIFLATVIWTLILYTVLEESGLAFENSFVWRQVLPAMKWSTVTAFLLATICCALVFVIFPRFNFQGFRGQFLQPVRKSGFSTQVEMGKSGKIFTDDTVVMRIEIAPEDRERWTGYIRGQALEVFDGTVWKNAVAPIVRVYTSGRGEINIPVQDERTGERIHQNIYLESMDSPVLFAASKPARFVMSRNMLELLSDGAVQRGNNDAWRVHYEVDSYSSQLDPATNRRNQMERYKKMAPTGDTLHMPKGLAALASFTESLLKDTRSEYESAQLISAHLRDNYQYSLQSSPPKKDVNPLEQFLFHSRKGHCEYFAATMCMMLRSRGIPARMATGFLSREWNTRGRYYMVRMRNAHAWVEAYIEPYGWMGFDPSPRDMSVSDTGPEVFRKYSEIMDYLNLRWNRYILSYDFERQVEIARSVTQNSNRISFRIGRFAGSLQKLADAMRNWDFSMFSLEPNQGAQIFKATVLFGLFVCAAVLLIVILVRNLFLRKKGIWFYPVLVRYLERKTGQKMGDRTLREFVQFAVPKLGETIGTVEFLQTQYYRLRFDPSVPAHSSRSFDIRHALKKL